MAANGNKLLKIGILSLGGMGAGIAALLTGNGFLVASNCTGRSQDTLTRAQRAGVELLSTDTDLVKQCQVILSVVPPRDAEATAQRIADAAEGNIAVTRDVYFADLNAVSPSTCRRIAAMFNKATGHVAFIDGCIIGGPPKKKEAPVLAAKRRRARVPATIPVYIARYCALKMSFASLTKGTMAIVTQAISTAHQNGVLSELEQEAKAFIPGIWDLAARMGPAMPPKAYRWVREMEEIADTFSQEAGWEKTLFQGVAGVYSTIAEDEVLGQETTEKRVRGKDLNDLAKCAAEGLQRKEKTD